MTQSIVVGGLGAAVAVEFPASARGPAADAELAARAMAGWSRGRLPQDHPVTTTLRARLGPASSGTIGGQTVREVLTTLTQEVTRALIQARAGDLLMFHAGAVAHTNGQTIAYVAPGGMGKTTLTRTLGRHFGYVTDETVGVDGAGRVLPYPKPLSVLPATGQKEEMSPDALDLRVPPADLTLAKLVLLRREPAAGASRVERLSTLDAISAMAGDTSSLPRYPRPLHSLADLLRRTGGAERWTYSEHTQLVPLVRAALGAS